jgi:hypothetical protein
MSRDESDREDLMREATALVYRAEIRVPSEADPVVAGFRRDGSLAVYFGSDPVYQFDDTGRLRRGFVDGVLYRTQGGTLARMTRHRTPEATELHRHDLTGEELQTFLKRMLGRISVFRGWLAADEYEVVEAVPAPCDVLPRLTAFLTDVLVQTEPLAPPVPGRR